MRRMLLAALLLPLPALSQTQGRGILPACVDTGQCTLCDLFSVASNAVNLLLGLVGAVALGFLLWNAFGLITAKGNSEAIKAGKEGVWKIAVGLFFLLLAWELVALTLAIVGGGAVKFPPWQGITCPPVRFK